MFWWGKDTVVLLIFQNTFLFWKKIKKYKFQYFYFITICKWVIWSLWTTKIKIITLTLNVKYTTWNYMSNLLWLRWFVYFWILYSDTSCEIFLFNLYIWRRKFGSVFLLLETKFPLNIGFSKITRVRDIIYFGIPNGVREPHVGGEACEAPSEAKPGMWRPRRGHALIFLIFHFCI